MKNLGCLLIILGIKIMSSIMMNRYSGTGASMLSRKLESSSGLSSTIPRVLSFSSLNLKMLKILSRNPLVKAVQQEQTILLITTILKQIIKDLSPAHINQSL